jgi:hypothetical protein
MVQGSIGKQTIRHSGSGFEGHGDIETLRAQVLASVYARSDGSATKAVIY